MDTLFRLVTIHHHHHHPHHPDPSPINSTTTATTRTSTSSPSSSSLGRALSPSHQECCRNPPMDDDDHLSSSSSKHFHPSYPVSTPGAASSTASYQSFDAIPADHARPPLPSEFASSTHPPPNWAATLLVDCARAIAAKHSARVQQLLWMLNELSSPYGDTDQKLAAYFLQALFARVRGTGQRTHRTLCSAAERGVSFESTRRTMLRFQEASPWATFGHVAANGAILEAFDGEPRLHIVDISTTHCTQWPTLLEALATRSDDTPHLKLTSVVLTGGAPTHRVAKEIGQRIEKFARLMGVPFSFSAVHCEEEALCAGVLDRVEIDPGEAVAVNCVGTLRRVAPGPERDAIVAAIARLRPKIVAIVEEEAEFGGGEADEDGEDDEERFVSTFRECLRFFSAYLESLDCSLPKTSNERLALERAAGRAIVDVVACPTRESAERRERAVGWARRLASAGFSPAAFSDDVADDVRALLKRYREGWSMAPAGDSAGIFLSWREQPVVWASAWKP
ncbi:unnamed protein product [Victoria cruziana]